MIRHGIIQLQASGHGLPVTGPRAPIVIGALDKGVTRREPGHQHRAVAQRGDLSKSIPALLNSGRAIADNSRKPKSP